jgi:hypothetical protein
MNRERKDSSLNSIKISQRILSQVTQHKVVSSKLPIIEWKQANRISGREEAKGALERASEMLGMWRDHLLRDCPHRQENNRTIHNIQEATTVNDVARTIPRIYVALEDRQVDHQASVVEVEGNIAKKYISILIDLGSSHNYVAPKVVDSCILQKCKHKKSWLVQLATRTKRKVSELVEACPLEMNGLFTWENLNILPLGSYDVLIGMDWLEA